MKKALYTIIFTLSLSLLFRLFFGVYTHDEFGDESLFLKYKPTWKWHFKSPIGMSDTKFNELSKEDKIEQYYFDEYVSQRGLSQ